MCMDGVSWLEGEGWKHGKLQGTGWMGGAWGVSEGCDEEGGDGRKCGGGWEARDGWNKVGGMKGKGHVCQGLHLAYMVRKIQSVER